MLVASTGQAAPYTSSLHVGGVVSGALKNSSTAAGKTCTPKNHNLNNNNNHNKLQQRSNTTINASSTSSASTAAAASALMKTLSVRLHRGTEFIKDTVQKALIVSTATSTTAAASTALTVPNSSSTILKQNTKIQNTHNTTTTTGSTTTTQVQRPRAVVAASSASFLKLYTVPPTALHRSTEARRRENAGSTDSLLKEMCHFKPIRPSPITPVKCGSKSRGFSLKIPKLIPAVRNMRCDDGDELDILQQAELRPKPSSPIVTTPHHSAFVCLLAHMNTNDVLNSNKANIVAINISNTKSKAKRERGRTKNVAQPKQIKQPQQSTPKQQQGRKRGKNNNNKKQQTKERDELEAIEVPPPPTKQTKKQLKQQQQLKSVTQQTKRKRKRKLVDENSDDDDDDELPLKIVRKSSRLPKDCNASISSSLSPQQLFISSTSSTNTANKKNSTHQQLSKKQKQPRKKRTNAAAVQTLLSCSPPMTRQRARQLLQVK